MGEIAIATEKLTRTFGALTAVDATDLKVQAGHFFGFLGPNGAGKSTTIKMLTGLLAPIMVVFFTMQFGKGSALREHSLKPEMFFPPIMAYLILILISPAYNAFAFEGKGIQTYFMAPLRFQHVLLGKNLFLVALVTFELSLSLALLVWRVGWPSTAMFAATITAGAFAVLGQLTIANWSSLSFPKKMEIGKLKDGCRRTLREGRFCRSSFRIHIPRPARTL